ncbi:MAG: nucleotidyl transferase AbiEii/AbiGii toxin family protein [Coriobacteriales bacterium]|jgi:predicted nucleotidyltransferase component of viral defense system|nr:nucleotidyl transferase AbiEii/AbiGii toxin family protein [Coriobacteriales bacterium]
MDFDKHVSVMRELVAAINADPSRFVLKGGTALMFCYDLDRNSVDIDLDGEGERYEKSSDALFKIVSTFCEKSSYDYRIGKDTNTVKRALINYGDPSTPLKVELSYRRRDIDFDTDTRTINGILVYSIDELCKMKASAYLHRDRIRDLYDLTFICAKYFDDLEKASVEVVRNAFEYKGLNEFDYLVRTQDDPLIDNSLLETRFLSAYDKVGLMQPSRLSARADEVRIVAHYQPDRDDDGFFVDPPIQDPPEI